MLAVQREVIIIACLTAAACAIPGTFLVLRRMSMLSDAISHSILLGIVAAFFFVQQISSPFLVFAAGVTGLVTVLLVEMLIKSRLVKKDAAIGFIYPLMFSIAVILISLFTSKIKIDTDSVLMGELVFAPLNRVIIDGTDYGAVAMFQIGGMFVINLILTVLFYKEIKITLLDENYADSLGFPSRKVNYGILVMVSFTTVVAFEVAGAIMVVGFMVGPAIIASYFSKRLWSTLVIAAFAGIVCSIVGYFIAHRFDVSITGSITTVIGVIFLLSMLFSPVSGAIAVRRRKKSTHIEHLLDALLVHLWQHELRGDGELFNLVPTVGENMGCGEDVLKVILNKGITQAFFNLDNDRLVLLGAGIERVDTLLDR